MKTHSPTHEEVAQRAREIWIARGYPNGCDTEIWLEAEHQLAENAAAHDSPVEAHPRDDGATQPGAAGSAPHAAPTPGETAAKAAQQKKSARAPKLPAKVAPKAPPAESGKPLWDKPHSS